MQMDSAEVGAYIMLLLAHYQAGLKGLPNDENKLRQITKSNPKVWARIKISVLAKFDLKDGFYTNPRVCDELKKMKSKAGPGRLKSDVGIPKSSDDETTSDTQVENKSLILKDTEKTNLKPKTYNHSKKDIYIYSSNDFEDFWKLCPRKVGKGAAMEKYKIARREIDKVEIEIAMTAHAKLMKGKETDFIPHPATWLHQKRYFDEAAVNVVEQEKKDWPEWKIKIAAHLGDHVVKSWFNTASLLENRLSFTKKFEFSHVQQFHGITLQKLGITEIILIS